MGYIEGLLGGFTERKSAYETQMREESTQSAAREAKIFEALLNSPDPETRALATAGLLQSAQPGKRKGGLRGWLGEMESSPYLQQIRDLSPEVAAEGGAPPSAAPSGAPGMIATPPAPGGSLAQSPTAATQVGAPPLTAIEPGPPEATVRGGGSGGEGMSAGLPPAAAPVPSLGVQAGLPEPAGPPGAMLTGQAPAQRMQPRQIFQTQEQQIISRYSAQEQGEIFGTAGAYEKAFIAQGVPPDEAKKRGLDLAIEERKRARGMGGASGMQSIAGEMPDGKPAFGVFDRAKGKYIDPNTQQPLEGFRPRTTTGSTSMGADRESISRELFGKRPTQLTSAEMAQVNDRLKTFGGEKAGAVTSGRGEAAADVPLSTQQRFQATTDLSAQWTKATANRTEIQRQYSLMQTGLSRYDADPIGGSQAILVTFQKVLDPTSVVRESEYARSPQGLAIMDRIQGAYDRYIGNLDPVTGKWVGGGAGVPKPVLAEMVKTAEAFLNDENMKSALANVRQRIYDTSTSYQIDPRLVLGTDAPPSGGTVGTPPPGMAAPAEPAAAGPGATGLGAEWVMKGGVLYHNGKPY